jgi:hypothetical protein
VVQPGEDAGLGQVGLDVSGCGDVLGVGHLDGDVAAQLVVVAAVDLAKAAGAQPAGDPVAPQPLQRPSLRGRGWTGHRGDGFGPGHDGEGAEGGGDGIGMFGEARLVLRRRRLLAVAAADEKFDGQQLAQQPGRLPGRHLRQEVLDARPLAGVPGGLEALAQPVHHGGRWPGHGRCAVTHGAFSLAAGVDRPMPRLYEGREPLASRRKS